MSTTSRLHNVSAYKVELWDWLPLAIVTVDRSGLVMETTGQTESLFGPAAAQAHGRPLEELLGQQPSWRQCFERACGGVPAAGVVEVAGRWLAASFNPAAAPDGDVTEIVIALLDLGKTPAFSGQSCGYGSLAELLEQVEAYRRELRLIGYEIHDGLVQYLTAAQMYLEDRMVRSARQGNRIAPEEIGGALKHVRSALAEARRLINSLRPPTLEQGGLVAAVQELLCDDATPVPEITLVVGRVPDRIDPLLENVIYRIVQEAVSNLRRHSQAAEATVRLNQVGRWIQVEIRDFGKGFDLQGARNGGVGLKSILHRAEMVGGWATIDSSPGRGTRVFVSVPMVGTCVPGTGNGRQEQ